MEWEEYRRLPKDGSTHVKEGYENLCENCMLEIDCECCDVSVPLVVEEWEIHEVTMRQDTMCGIPVGHPYEVVDKMENLAEKGNGYVKGER